MEYPKITLVTPSFNSLNFLEQTIKSVIHQNYPNIEYIIIDGASTDGSVGVIKKYEKYLAYWCSEPDNGMYDALSKGFSRSSGQIMGWINADDILFPWTLFTLAEIFTRYPGVEWLSALYPCAVNKNGTLFKSGGKKGYAKKYFYNGLYMTIPGRQSIGFIQQESTFWRRSLYEKAGGMRSSLQYAGDFDLWARFFQHSELHGMGCMLGGFRYHNACQLSNQHFDLYLNEAIASLERNGGGLCSPLKARLLMKHMNLMAQWPKFKCPSLGQLELVHNILWNKEENQWEIVENWI